MNSTRCSCFLPRRGGKNKMVNFVKKLIAIYELCYLILSNYMSSTLCHISFNPFCVFIRGFACLPFPLPSCSQTNILFYREFFIERYKTLELDKPGFNMRSDSGSWWSYTGVSIGKIDVTRLKLYQTVSCLGSFWTEGSSYFLNPWASASRHPRGHLWFKNTWKIDASGKFGVTCDFHLPDSFPGGLIRSAHNFEHPKIALFD